MATAIESIYRDLEYARSLIKHTPIGDHDEEGENEHSTSRNHDHSLALSPDSSVGSIKGAPSEDWSVISDQDDHGKDRKSSDSSRESEGKGTRDGQSKRASIAAAMLSVLPDSLTSASPRLRTLSGSSRQ